MNATASTVAKEAPDRPSLIKKFAGKYSIDPKVLMSTLKATCFRVQDGEVSDEQMVALLVVADQYNLNPFTKEIYAFPDKNKGIVPVVSVDGWVRIVNEHSDFNGYDVILPDAMLSPIPGERPAAWEWVTIRIHRKNVEFTPELTEYLDECYRPPIKKNGNNGPYVINGPWQTHPKRFLRHKAFIQAGRLVFGFSGIYDEDEAARILEASVVSTQTAASAADAAKQNLRRALESKPAPAEGSIEAGLRGVTGERVQGTWEESVRETAAVQTKLEQAAEPEKPKFKFDISSAVAHLRTRPTLADLKVAWREISDDYEFSGREMPIDVEAIFRDLKEGFEQKEAKK